jgi:hypothetical protein
MLQCNGRQKRRLYTSEIPASEPYRRTGGMSRTEAARQTALMHWMAGEAISANFPR